MHIMITANSAWNILNFRRPIVEALSRDDHQITVLAPADDSAAKLECLNCRMLPLEMNVKGLNPLQDLKLQHRFKRTFREEQPDIVLSYTIKNNIFGGQAAQLLGVPFLPNVTGLGTAFLSGKLLQTVTEQLYRRSFRNLSVVFFQNEDDRDLFLNRSMVRADQARLLPGSGIDLVHFPAVPMRHVEGPTIFLMISRLIKDKGVFEFIEAARRIKARHPQAQFKLIGEVASKNRSAIGRGILNSWIAEGVIEYLGTVEDVRPAIEAATCIVLPSYREGVPRALIEAAAMARPVITTDVPGCRAVVDHDISGFLCEVRNSESLTAAIERFLALLPEAKQAMGQAGRAKMEREYNHSIVVGAYREAITGLVKAKQNQ